MSWSWLLFIIRVHTTCTLKHARTPLLCVVIAEAEEACCFSINLYFCSVITQTHTHTHTHTRAHKTLFCIDLPFLLLTPSNSFKIFLCSCHPLFYFHRNASLLLLLSTYHTMRPTHPSACVLTSHVSSLLPSQRASHWEVRNPCKPCLKNTLACV